VGVAMGGYFLIVEDDPIFASGLAVMLGPYGGTEIATSVAAGRVALATRPPTALFLDFVLPDGCGLDVIGRAPANLRGTPTLVITGLDLQSVVNRAFDVGARVLYKPITPIRLRAFLEDVAGRPVAGTYRLDAIANAWSERHGFTETEAIHFRLALEGKEHSELAAATGISTETVRKHVRNILQKTGDRFLRSAVLRALREPLPRDGRLG